MQHFKRTAVSFEPYICFVPGQKMVARDWLAKTARGVAYGEVDVGGVLPSVESSRYYNQNRRKARLSAKETDLFLFGKKCTRCAVLKKNEISTFFH